MVSVGGEWWWWLTKRLAKGMSKRLTKRLTKGMTWRLIKGLDRLTKRLERLSRELAKRLHREWAGGGEAGMTLLPWTCLTWVGGL